MLYYTNTLLNVIFLFCLFRSPVVGRMTVALNRGGKILTDIVRHHLLCLRQSIII